MVALSWAAAATTCVLAALGMYASRGWPIYNDAPLMFFVAQRIAEGGAPYRDVLDMNMPGAYLISLAVLSVAGLSDFAWRLVDLGALVGIALCLFWIVRPASVVLGITAAATIMLVHLKAGPDDAGQRDFLMTLPVLLALTILLVADRDVTRISSVLRHLMVGMLLTSAALLKPTAIVLAGPTLLFVLLRRGLSAGSCRDAGAFIAGASIVVMLIAAWLHSRGALLDFLIVQLDFVIPSYSKIKQVPSTYLGTKLVLLALVGVPFILNGRHRVRYMSLLLLVAFGMFHFHVQGKYWGYHAAPLEIFSVAAAFLGLGMLTDRMKHETARLSAVMALLVAQTAVVAMTIEGFGARSWLSGQTTVRANDELVRRLVGDLAELSIGPAGVQPLDTTFGVLNAMLRLGHSMPTRLMYGFPLYLPERTPFLDGLREEFLAGLRKSAFPPLIRTNQQLPYAYGYDRLETWPAFRELIDRHYTIAVERSFPDNKGYRIYVARHP